jgi:hypothetical protein
MTRDPVRYLQDSAANPELARLLTGSAVPLDLPGVVKARVGATLEQLVANAAATSVAASNSVGVGTHTSLFATAAGKSLGFVGLASVAVVAGGLVFAGIGSRQRSTPNAVIEHSPNLAADRQTTQPNARAALPVEQAPAKNVSDLPFAADTQAPSAKLVSKQPARATTRRDLHSSLAEEARLLETVRASLTLDRALARRALTEYDSTFPAGVLKEERNLLAVKLAVAEGRHGDAKAQANQMELTSQRSPFSKKARALAGSSEQDAGSRTNNE